MAENEYPIRVPVVDYEGDERKVIGEAEIDAEGNTTLIITDADYARVVQPPAYSLSLPGEPQKSLQDVINEGLTEAADAAHETVVREIEKNTAWPWNFTGLAGIPREVMEADAEDHIVRGTD